jgi:PAS domain S-box-containing protein
LEVMTEAWREPWFLVPFRRHTVLGWASRYSLAPVAVAAALAARQALTVGFGTGLPAYITFYPAVMTVGLLGGLGPGLLATVIAGCVVDYWVLPPVGSFVIASPLDRLGMVIFVGMGLSVSVVTELYRRHRGKAATYDRQAALRASETRYRLLFEMITEGFSLDEILFDAAGRAYDLRYLAVNPAFERQTGLKADDIIGRTTLELFPQAEPVWFEFYGKVVRTGEPASLEAWFGPLNRCFQVNAFRFEPGICGVVFFDITERKRAEEALRQSQEWLRVTLASIGDAVIACDTGGRVTFVNPVAASLTGWPAAEALGQPIEQVFRIINEQSRGPAEDIVARVLREHRLVGLANHTALVDRNGRETPIADSAAPILDDQGAVTGVVLVFRDVTEARRAEQELRDSEAALKEADRRKDEFLAMLSHELRNPLAAIANSMYLLDHEIPGSETAYHAQAVIGRQARLLSRLVDDLLDVTRISRNKIQLQFERMDLVQVARRTVEDHRGSIEANGVRLDFVSPGGAVWVKADSARVTQMVGNLVLNAGKFTDRNGAVTVEIQAQDAQATVAVTDTGMGMDEAMLGRLFQPFAQADRSLDRSRGGLGLGLALVKGLAELHGGRVTASSPGLGAGSRFALTLPMASRPEGQRAGQPAQVLPLPPHRILIIEDNLDAALTLKMLLEHGGHEVVTAHSGRAGLAKAKAHRPEVIFCDIGLPDMDGYAVAQALRADPECHPALLVAMTGYGQDEDKRRALEAGFDQHLTKPADPDALQRMLAF